MKLRFGIAAGIALAFFTLYPQLKLVYLRGDDWNGHYAYNDIDEVAYASYLRALIDGRPRRNDPYSGRDDTPADSQPESLFSIQFAAPYSIAIPARIIGIGTPWAMTLSGAIAGFLAALAAFWLIARFTDNSWYAMAGSLVVFAGGAVFAGEGAALELFFEGFSYPYFPGFRRWVPAMAMPAAFGFFGLIWRVFSRRCGTPKNEIENFDNSTWSCATLLSVLAACACFAFTVFSYFYIWTTAVAWLVALGIIWIAARPPNFQNDLKLLAVIGAGCFASLLPYAYLLSNRSKTMDNVQLLVYTRSPDFWRMPEYISVFCLILIAVGLFKRYFELRKRKVLFCLSFVLVPLIVFNQQILTGHSLQPIHYQVFIGNYVAGLALVLTIGLFVAKRPTNSAIKFVSAAVALLAFVWGVVECKYTVRVLDEANIERDIAYPVARRLDQLAKFDQSRHQAVVFSNDMIQADDLPTAAPQSVLWARHQHVFSGLNWQQNKERYYQYLYYTGVDEKALEWMLKNDFVSKIALFGWGRHT
ncbi:MAG: hypothetical protein LC734_00685, partial [Acidobacteria bacterium]|nr:hypothetical protein [Acidobacteriota bacterium]